MVGAAICHESTKIARTDGLRGLLLISNKCLTAHAREKSPIILLPSTSSRGIAEVESLDVCVGP